MNLIVKQQLRAYISDALVSKGDRRKFSDDESLFVSGRLDFLSMVRLVMHLEQAFGVNFLDTGWDIALVDSLTEIELLIDLQEIKAEKIRKKS